MPSTRRHKDAPTGASTSEAGGECSPLQQCAHTECQSRIDDKIPRMVEIEKYASWGMEKPFLCLECNYHQCSLCRTAYATLAGISQHFRRKHSERYHQGEASRTTVKLRWTDGMMIRMAKEEAKLRKLGVRFVNQELQKLLPEYTIEQIKGVRNKKGRYTELLAD